MPQALALMIVVITQYGEGPEDAIDRELGAAFAHKTRFGLVSGIDPVRQLLEQVSHQVIGGFEDGRAQQYLEIQFLNGELARIGGQKPCHQLLDFLVPGEEEVWSWAFFLESAAMAWRVRSITCWAYCWVRDSKR